MAGGTPDAQHRDVAASVEAGSCVLGPAKPETCRTLGVLTRRVWGALGGVLPSNGGEQVCKWRLEHTRWQVGRSLSRAARQGGSKSQPRWQIALCGLDERARRPVPLGREARREQLASASAAAPASEPPHVNTATLHSSASAYGVNNSASPSSSSLQPGTSVRLPGSPRFRYIPGTVRRSSLGSPPRAPSQRMGTRVRGAGSRRRVRRRSRRAQSREAAEFSACPRRKFLVRG
jgi:hypothetical protein